MRNLIGCLTGASADRPHAPAVELQGQTLSYAELDARSTALAELLARRGVGPGDRVGLWLRKSFESIVGIYGVLKAGAAYVPIDPSAPLDRAAKIITDCELACIISHEEQVGWLVDLDSGAPRDRLIISVGTTQEVSVDAAVVLWTDAVSGAPAGVWDRPADIPTPEDPAYILYTSGSKGTPKGVVLSHDNALAFVEWTVREFGITADDRVASHAPLHFDLSVLDVFATCLAGACVILLPESQVGLGGVLNRVVVERKVTVWYSVPNALNRMLTAKNSELLSGSALSVVLFAGETFPLGALRRLRALVPQAALYNLYGPTETNVCTFHQVVDSDLAPGRTEPVPIGRPCPYTRTYVVDADGEPLDQVPGAVGELCVSGASIMQGYWRDDSLTVAKTLRIRQADGSAVDAYRTGDTVRVEADGGYAFLGRNDDMVKVRGHRVELGEVESAISEAEAVGEVVCVAVPDTAGEKHLEAYVVLLSQDCEGAGLKRHCLSRLPRYMVPERFHFVSALPRTQSGKLDRRGLIGS